MPNTSSNQKSKISKYKKEIGWLLKEKYFLDFKVIPDETWDLSSWISAFVGLTKDTVGAINSDIERIINCEPVDYVIGFKEFLNCKIDLSLKPLIPRVETEFWVEQEIKNINSNTLKNKIKILDLCCGSGCIGVSILKNIPNSFVTFVDVSDTALKQTEINLQINNLQFSHNFQLIKSNLFENLKGQNFDYIFTNPPYIKNKDIKGSLLYEPKLALDGEGEDGLEIVTRILEQFSNYINPYGALFLEFGYGQKTKIEKKIKELGTINYEFKRDQFGKYRSVSIYI